MAKKQEEFKYLNLPIPTGAKTAKSKFWRANLGLLEKRDVQDSVSMKVAENIVYDNYPDITVRHGIQKLQDKYCGSSYNVISFAGIDDFMFVVYTVPNSSNTTNKDVMLDYIVPVYDNNTCIVKRFVACTCTLKSDVPKDDLICTEQRSFTKFNVYNTNGAAGILGGSYTRKILIMPDKVSIPYIKPYYEVSSDSPGDRDKSLYWFNTYNNDLWEWNADATEPDWNRTSLVPDPLSIDNIKTYTDAEGGKTIPNTFPVASFQGHKFPPETANKSYYWFNSSISDNTGYLAWSDESGEWIYIPGSALPTFPSLKYACSHLSRLFGVDDTIIYASGYNDYANWALDNVDEYSEANAWVSTAQSNTKADGTFTGITNYDGHIICFKRGYMHEIYNTKNPFRVVDIFADGTIDNRSIAEVNGQLLFVSEDGVKRYTGGAPKIISLPIQADNISYAVCGSCAEKYYFYCLADGVYRLFVYDSNVGGWSEFDSYLFRQDFGDRSDPSTKTSYHITGEFNDVQGRIIGFATVSESHEGGVKGAYQTQKIYCMDSFGFIYKFDTEDSMQIATNRSYTDVFTTVTPISNFEPFDIGYDEQSRRVEKLTEATVQTSFITSSTLDIKHIRKMLTQFVLNNLGSKAEIYVTYDNEESDEPIHTIRGESASQNKKYKVSRVKLAKTAHYMFGTKIKLFGDSRIKNIDLDIEGGGVIYRDTD